MGLAGGLGAYNHFVIVPELEAEPAHQTMLSRAKMTISAEMVLLLAASLVTVFLTGASINE